MIRYKFLDRGDRRINGEIIVEPVKKRGLQVIMGGKAQEVKSILKQNELEQYLLSKSMLLIYGSQIEDTPVAREMKNKEFLIMYEEKEIDDEICIDVSPTIGKVFRIEGYLYKDELGDIMYLGNPYYKGDVLDCMEYEYRVVIHRGEYTEEDGMLIERPEYNNKFLQKLGELGYSLVDMTFKSIEFDSQIIDLVKLVSPIYGQTIIKGSEAHCSPK